MEESNLNEDTINFIPNKSLKKVDSEKRYKVTEILLILSAVGIVVFLGLLAINPSKEASEARNLKRTADISTVLTYISGYVDRKKDIPTSLPTSETCV